MANNNVQQKHKAKESRISATMELLLCTLMLLFAS